MRARGVDLIARDFTSSSASGEPGGVRLGLFVGLPQDGGRLWWLQDLLLGLDHLLTSLGFEVFAEDFAMLARTRNPTVAPTTVRRRRSPGS
jgi:hypothetical protein